MTQGGPNSYNLKSNWSGYDMNTFYGRLMHYFEVCGPHKSFHSEETLKGF